MHNITRCLASVLLLALSLLLPSAMAGDDKWYEKTEWTERNPFQWGAGQMFVAFPKTGIRLGGSDPHLYALMTSGERDAIWSEPSHAKVVDHYSVKPESVKGWHDFFASKAEAVQLPYWFDTLGLLPKIPNHVTGGITLIDILLHAPDNNTVRARANELSAVIEVGGIFERTYLIFVDPAGHEFLSSNIIYTVKVGDKVRNYAIESATYALKVQALANPPYPPTSLSSEVH
ncbi:MAG TPA: hypothetical protein VJO35_03040 [Terriglobales bacterium]|nr:hypothetical protein [Terriglobales bacterium]